MKIFIVGAAVILMCAMFLVFQQDLDRHERELFNCKFVAEETAAAAAQYIDPVSYSQGKIVFNQTQGLNAAKFILQTNLNLDSNFKPLLNSYLQNQVAYNVLFFDDSNTTYPYTYTDPKSGLVLIVTGPSVIVKINEGKPQYMPQFVSLPDIYRIAMHTWQQR